ncbi:Myogenic factor 5 [Manis javanica]|nr:Myogenic factor 5 [Manis javanica]
MCQPDGRSCMIYSSPTMRISVSVPHCQETSWRNPSSKFLPAVLTLIPNLFAKIRSVQCLDVQVLSGNNPSFLESAGHFITSHHHGKQQGYQTMTEEAPRSRVVPRQKKILFFAWIYLKIRVVHTIGLCQRRFCNEDGLFQQPNSVREYLVTCLKLTKGHYN